MTISTFTSKFPARLTGGLLGGVMLTLSVGCQTFSLSEEDFRRQQRGEAVDRETGEVVEVMGTAGCLGAIVGGAVAEAVKK